MPYREVSTPRKVDYPQEVKGLQLHVWRCFLHFAFARFVITPMLRGRKDALTIMLALPVFDLRMRKGSMFWNLPFAMKQMIEALVLAWKITSHQSPSRL